MKKVIIIGCPGSGKTTFAQNLKKCTGLPLFHLDAIWHKPDRTHITREEFDKKISEIFKLDRWIMDGDYSRTMEMRMKMCDTVFMFDLPTEVCISGVTERIGKSRPDIPWVDTELDINLKQEIEKFPFEKLPVYYNLFEKYKQDRQIIIFKTRAQADEFLKGLDFV